jgi:outer membrane protein OmpA-like peptidoglycan-associated protein
MRRTLTPGLLGAFAVAAALTATSWAQDAPHDEDTVKKEDVKTWTVMINGDEYEVRPATPTYEGTTGLFHLPSAYTLEKGKFSFSLFRDNLDRDPKDEDISIHGLSLGYGATDRLEIFGNFGLQNRVDADALFQPGFVNDYPFVSTSWETGVGDVKLGLKFKFLDDERGDSVGLAARGYVKLPTADEAKGLGTGKVSFGGDVIISKSIEDKLDLHGSLGFIANSDPDGVNIGNAFRWGAGLNFPSCYWIQLQAEIMGTSYTGDDDFPQTNPLDVVVGPVIWIKPGFFIRPGISWNFNFDDRGLNSGSATYTGRHIAIGYHPGTRCRKVYVPPPPPPPPANANPTVTCDIERSTVLPGESVGVRATASDPDGDPLSYEWSATAGRIVGSGPAVTCETAGMAPGSSSTITVRVSDGRGGSASATCNLNIQAPAPKAEVITCTSGGFPRNRERLNNVDKACLDDVATRLKQDPRSRVIIVGHADSTERRPDVIARKRGEAVKAYLVTERGIEEARITVRSAGASKPLDTGKTAAARAKNRRVELTFIPEGATPPPDVDDD